MTGEAGEVGKRLFLHHKSVVPFWALSYVFGKDDMVWYRVGSTMTVLAIPKANTPDH